MSDNPFIEPEDSERTVIRPMPGGRRSAAADAPVGVAEPPRPSPAAGVSSEGAETFAMGLSPLVARWGTTQPDSMRSVQRAVHHADGPDPHSTNRIGAKSLRSLLGTAYPTRPESAWWRETLGLVASCLQPRLRGLPRSGVGPPLTAGGRRALTCGRPLTGVLDVPASALFRGRGWLKPEQREPP